MLIAEETKSDIVMPDRFNEVIESIGKQKTKMNFSDNEKIENPIEFVLKVIIAKGRAWRSTSLLYSSKIIQKNNISFPLGYTQEDIVFNLDFLSHANKISFYNKSTLNYLKRTGSITASYNEKLTTNFIFIDKRVEKFLNSNNIKTLDAKRYRDSLFCRNIVISISYLFAPNNIKFNTKLKKANEIYNIKRVRQAFKTKNKSIPFFNSFFAQKYFQIMFFLISNKLKFLANLLAIIGGKKMIQN